MLSFLVMEMFYDAFSRILVYFYWTFCDISDLDVCKSVFDWLTSWHESSWSFHTIGYLDDAHW